MTNENVTPSGVPLTQQEALDHAREVRARQHSRATVMALLLGAFVVLIFAISIAKIALHYN